MNKLAIAIGAAALALPTAAHAFCGFYVSGSGDKMFADATQVVLMRDGTKTVLSMQNDYKGPLSDFAMVVPVPVVLHEKDVKTLAKSVFEHVDSLGSPRLVEYWEQDPCFNPPPPGDMELGSTKGGRVYYDAKPAPTTTVKIEAKFDVAEYKILVLSAMDSTGLERWLTQNHYQIPPGAEPLLRPYVEGGSKFFVAKVDPSKVQMVAGHAALSPLRFSYDSEEFALPIRLGMANSSGKQDLIVNIVAPDKRYEVSNYKNVTIPTNFDLKDSAKARFGEFYAALFDKTMEVNPRAIVTEYAWTAMNGYHCDPCPTLDVTPEDLMSLGGDLVGGKIATGNFVLTRLHARYGKDDITDDLRFKAASPITGGREQMGASGALETGAVASAENYFQARYAIRHAWTGPVACKTPHRNVWGGPPDGAGNQVIAATKLAFAPRGALALPSVIKADIKELGVRQGASSGGGFSKPPGGGKAMGLGLGVLGGLALIGLGILVTRRRL